MTPETRRWLFVSDVDDTLTGNAAALARLAAALAPARGRLVLAYNSSRPGASIRQTLAAEPALPAPDYVIGALGTEIEAGATGAPLEAYAGRLGKAWPRAAIAAIAQELGFRPHPAEFQTPWKASFDVPGEEAAVQFRGRLAAAGIAAQVIFSGGKNLDAIHPAAGKGAAIAFLRELEAFPPEQVVVAGDSANDLDMFDAAYKGIVVANADPELRARRGAHIYHAQAPHAAGVLEGLRHWGVLP